MKESELKNCPFCGREPKVEYFCGAHFISCNGEDSTMHPIITATDTYQDRAIAIWNTRTDPNKDKLVEALKLLLEAKRLKETSGKDAAYQELKKRAWEAAEAAIAGEG